MAAERAVLARSVGLYCLRRCLGRLLVGYAGSRRLLRWRNLAWGWDGDLRNS